KWESDVEEDRTYRFQAGVPAGVPRLYQVAWRARSGQAVADRRSSGKPGRHSVPIPLKERPVFMIGAERSGTTLVMAMLGCHPRIAVPEVVWYYPRFRPYLYSYGDLSKSENLRTLAEEMVFGLKT